MFFVICYFSYSWRIINYFYFFEYSPPNLFNMLSIFWDFYSSFLIWCFNSSWFFNPNSTYFLASLIPLSFDSFTLFMLSSLWAVIFLINSYFPINISSYYLLYAIYFAFNYSIVVFKFLFYSYFFYTDRDPESKFLVFKLWVDYFLYKVAFNYKICLSFYNSSLMSSEAPIFCSPSSTERWKSAVFLLFSNWCLWLSINCLSYSI